MLINNIDMDRIQASLNKLIPIIGPDVVALPLRIDNNIHGPIAWTNVHGANLRRDVAENDPDNAHVYFFHEFLHHVIDNHEYTHEYHPRIVNYAEDYWINYTMNSRFGFDPRKVKYKLIYSSKYGKMVPHRAAKLLTAKASGKNVRMTMSCGCSGLAHPLIIKTAREFREKYQLGLRERQGRLVACDPIDEGKFLYRLPQIRSVARLNTVPVDLPNLVEGLFMAAYKADILTPEVGRTLTKQEAIAYCWQNNEMRETSINNDERSALAAIHYLNVLNELDTLIRIRLSAAIANLGKAQDKVEELQDLPRPPKRKINKLFKRIAQIERRIVRLRAIEPLLKTMRENEVVPAKRKYFSINSMRRPKARPLESTVLSVKSNKTTALLKFASNIATRRYRKSVDLQEELEAAFGHLLSGGDDVPEEAPETPIPEQERQERPTPPVEEKEEAPREEETDDEEEEQSEDTAEDEDDEYDDDDPEVRIEEPTTGGGGGAGKEKGSENQAPPMLKLLAEIDNVQMRKLDRILTHMAEFETKLTTKKNRDTDEFAPTLDILPTFGDDVSRADQSELALLAREDTKLLFYSRVAQGSLLLRYPQRAKRMPVAIAIDASGSMSGQRYEIACGFALAMMKKMHSDNRGGMFLIFSERVTFSIVIKANKPFKMNQIIYMLLTPQFGGTDFDSALYQIFEAKKAERWKGVATLMVTDGGDSISQTMMGYLDINKTPQDKITAVLTGSNCTDAGFHGVNDETIQVDRNGLTNTLTRLGNSIL